jgi:subtilisin family serine protease
MNTTTRWLCGLTLLGLAACDLAETPTSPDLVPSAQLAREGGSQANLSINVLLDRPATDAILAQLGTYGRVSDRIDAIQAVMMRSRAEDLPAIQALPFVVAANPDAERGAGPPLPPVGLDDFTGGFSTWNLDAVDVTAAPGPGQRIAEDGEGVYIGVLDTGLLDSWRFYFPDERIAEEYARSFTGGPVGPGAATQPNKWEHDVQSHGTHVTSTILGYSLNGTPINGVAPAATVIPVKVLNNNGSGWSSTIAHGIVYIAELKAGPLSGAPVVINMSLGGSQLDAVEKAAIDYAIAQGVVIVASAGNRGEVGMGYPGGYEPVISVGAVGWAGQWTSASWWNATDVSEPTNPAQFYVADFSSRELPGQDLDVLAPGSWVVGPYQLDRGHTSYFFLSGTSMASPHVAGIVALMAQKNAGLTAPMAESILESTASPLTHTSLNVFGSPGVIQQYTWSLDDATGSGIVSATAALAATP